MPARTQKPWGSIKIDLPQETYLDAENQAISELKKLHKPFLVLVN